MTMTGIPPLSPDPVVPTPAYRLEGVTRTYRQRERTVKALDGIDVYMPLASMKMMSAACAQ